VPIKDIQDAVRELHEQHDWPVRTAESRALWLSIEVGELLREVQQYGWDLDRVDEIWVRASHEMYDVMWNLVDLATIMGIDLGQAFTEKAPMNR
jgi:NTP pyrophosphatase (non-canonical NTP hydrolase)